MIKANSYWLISIASLTILMTACTDSIPSSAVEKTKAAGTTIKSSLPAQRKNDMSPMETLLDLFASKEAMSWTSFDAVSGIQWRDSAPVENPDATTKDATHYRSGNLILAGFGTVDVPDGKEGAEAGTKQDNEGNVGVTLNGDANHVYSIALQKFYPSEDYEEILQRQFGNATAVKLVADQCVLDYGTTAENTQKNKFFKIVLATGTVYAEAYVDEDGGNQGPGSTTFEFYRSRPTQRITSMHCKEP